MPSTSWSFPSPLKISTNAPGGILFLLRSVTNAVAMLLNSTNQWSGTVHAVDFTNCALHLADLVNSRPATLGLDDITLSAKNISNIPATNLTAAFSLRWNTNGTINTKISASFSPTTADVKLDVDRLDLTTLDPYLEPKLNLFILGSEVGLARHHATAPAGRRTNCRSSTFHGGAQPGKLHTVDGVFGEDLVEMGRAPLQGHRREPESAAVAIREIGVDNAYARLIVETNQDDQFDQRPATGQHKRAGSSETNAPASAKNRRRPTRRFAADKFPSARLSSRTRR